MPDTHRQVSQEFHLVSSDDANVAWLLGAYIFAADRNLHFFQFTPVLNRLPTFNNDASTESNAYALFGQLTLPIALRWSLTGGLRFSYEDRRVGDIGTGTADHKTLTTASNSWDRVSWRVDLEYAATDNTLYYAGASTGFKSGGITTQQLPNGDFDSFDAEHLIAYEFGIKTSSGDRRIAVNGAAFLYDFNDLQVTTVYFDGATTVIEVENAAGATIHGIDAAGSFRINDRWTVDAGAVWLPRREFTDFRQNTISRDLSGNKLSRAAEWSTTTSIGYQRGLRDYGTISGRMEYNYRSKYFFTKDNEPLFAQGDFGLLNVLVRFDSRDEKWYVFGSARNLTDEDYFTQVFFQAAPGYPDTYEIGFGLHF